MVLSLVGLFGLVSYTAQQLTREIGIRKVLGASLFHIVKLLSSGYMRLVLVAVLISFPVSWFVMNAWLSDFAYRVPLNFWVFVGAGFLSALLAMIIVGIRGLNAGSANPVRSLKSE
jgi:putative ABC transport system permease protein